MSRIRIDDSRWPLITVSYPATFPGTEWTRLMDRLMAAVKSGEDFGMVNDVRTGQLPSAAQRKQIADMYDRYRPEIAAHWKGTAVIGSSAVVRGVITALTWLTSAPHPSKVFASVEEGERWVWQQLGRPPTRNA